MTKTRWLVPLALVMLAGCFDVVPVTDPKSPPPGSEGYAPVHLRVGVGFYVSSAPAIRINGALWPGRDNQGRKRQLSDGRLWILDRAILPQERDYSHWYNATVSETAGDSVEVRFPLVEGVDSFPAVWGYPVRSASRDTLTLAAGEDLVLRLMHGRTPPDTTSGWALQVRGERGELAVSRQGAVPEAIRVGRHLLPPPTADGWRVLLTAGERRRMTHPGTGHEVEISFDSHLEWHVRALAP